MTLDWLVLFILIDQHDQEYGLESCIRWERHHQQHTGQPIVQNLITLALESLLGDCGNNSLTPCQQKEHIGSDFMAHHIIRL